MEKIRNSMMVKSIAEILQTSNLAKIIEKTSKINELNRNIQRLLPENYRSFYRILNLVDDQLIIEVQSATVRQGFQLQHTQLLRLIQQSLPQVNQLKFKVNPDFKPHY